MTDFMIRFGICNLFLCGIIGILLLARRLFKNSLSSHMQYHLWFLLLGLLTVPFLPFRLFKLPQIILWFQNLSISPISKTEHTIKNAMFLFVIWLSGILTTLIILAKSVLRLRDLKKSSLPLQSRKIQNLYIRCLNESGITKKIPIYSTVFLKSPIITGLFRPCIYFPIHLISDDNEADIRYMLLHELQHYKHKDGVANYLMNFAKIIYWFNPLVRYALKEMKNDCEIACDTSVLNILKSSDYMAYGNTLLHFAEKISLTPFPFASGISGNMKQMKRRIMNIASYEKPTLKKRLKGIVAFLLTSVLLFGLAPFVSTYAADETHYQQNVSQKNVSKIDFSDYFGEYEGCFVLYDLKNDAWKIHDKERASLRVAPNSTYKIYSALFGLENDIITPESSLIQWNGENYPFEAWNKDQTLQSAMTSSVNWYFQSIDEQLGAGSIQNHLQKIGYGNENLNGNFSSYWMESSLKISPIEQADNTYFFASNIHAKDHADGSTAAKIAMTILSDMSIWK